MKAIYDYSDNGTLVQQVVRYDPKAFRPRVPHPDGGWRNIFPEHRVIYNLNGLRVAEKDDFICYCEGEKDADTCIEHGLTATTHAGGANGWRREFATEFEGRKVVLFPHNDDDSRRMVRDITADLVGVANEVKVVDLVGLEEHGDITDWFNAGGSVERLGDLVNEAPFANAGPEKRKWTGRTVTSMREAVAEVNEDERPWPAPPGPQAYGGIAGEVVKLCVAHSEADPVAVLVHFLAGFSCLVGYNCHSLVGATRHGTNIFPVVVGRTAKARKGDSSAGPLRLLKIAAPLWAGEVGGLSSGEGLINAVRDPSEACDQDGNPIDEGVDDKRLLVVESEFARVLVVMSRQGNTVSQVLREAWDGKTLRVMTRALPLVATEAQIVVVGHITVDELRRVLDDVSIANGFANRFIVVAAKRSRLLPEPDALDDAKLRSLAEKLARILEWAQGVTMVERDAEARELWRAVYPDLSRDRPGLAGSLLARAEAQVLRLSMIYALLDRSVVMTPRHLVAALELWAYSERSIEFIFGDATGDPVADQLLEALRRNGEFTRTQIRDLFGRNQREGRIERALQLLVRTGRARTFHRDTGGRPVEIWVST